MNAISEVEYFDLYVANAKSGGWRGRVIMSENSVEVNMNYHYINGVDGWGI